VPSALNFFHSAQHPPDAEAQAWIKAKKRFFRALDSCTTLTEINVDDIGRATAYFSPEEMRLLQDGRTDRNSELWYFPTNPSGYNEWDKWSTA